MSVINNSGNNISYHDFGGLQRLRTQAAAEPEAAIDQVARQFESVFVRMMLQEMRKTVPEGGLLDNQTTQMYQDMLDGQLATTLSGQGGIGLAPVIARQLRGNAALMSVSAAPAAAPAPMPATSADAEALRWRLLSSGSSSGDDRR